MADFDEVFDIFLVGSASVKLNKCCQNYVEWLGKQSNMIWSASARSNNRIAVQINKRALSTYKCIQVDISTSFRWLASD